MERLIYYYCPKFKNDNECDMDKQDCVILRDQDLFT